jgi:hypothetical protein
VWLGVELLLTGCWRWICCWPVVDAGTAADRLLMLLLRWEEISLGR